MKITTDPKVLDQEPLCGQMSVAEIAVEVALTALAFRVLLRVFGW